MFLMLSVTLFKAILSMLMYLQKAPYDSECLWTDSNDVQLCCLYRLFAATRSHAMNCVKRFWLSRIISIFCFGGNIYSKKKFLLWCFFFNKFCVHVAALLLSQNIHWSLNNWCSLGNFLSNFKILMFSPLLLKIFILYMFFFSLLNTCKTALYNFDYNLI